MMDDLISRAAAIEYLMTNMGWHDEDGFKVDDADEKRSVITDLVNGIPDVDAAPVVHARWIHCDGESHIWYCSNCGEKVNYNNAHKVYAKSTRPIEEVNHFCRNCGAKMDGERRDDE